MITIRLHTVALAIAVAAATMCTPVRTVIDSPNKKFGSIADAKGLQAGGTQGARVKVSGGEGNTNITEGDAANSDPNAIRAALASHPKDEDLVWSNEDDIHAQSEAMDELFSKKAKRQEGWGKSFSDAMRYARRENKCILLWFDGDHKLRPKTQHLSNELLMTGPFFDWAKDNLTCVRFSKEDDVAKDIKIPEGSSMTRLQIITERQRYVDAAFKHYKVKNTPTLVLVSASGEVIQTWKDYDKGQGQSLFAEIKHCSQLGNASYDKFKQSLARKGFRTWTTSDGVSVFAAPSRIDEKAGTVWLREYDGRVTPIRISNLRKEDQEQLTTQK